MNVIFLDMAGTFVLVDPEDHAWASQWTWAKKPSRAKKNGTPRKVYACRTGYRAGLRQSIYLHVEICERHNGPPPTWKRSIADHKNGREHDCRRENLRWVTPRSNRKTAKKPMRDKAPYAFTDKILNLYDD